MLAKLVQAAPLVTDAQKFSLGLNVRAAPTPVPPPSTSPNLDVVSVTAWTVKIKLHDAASGKKRGRPPGVKGVAVFSCVAAAPPTDLNDWHFEGNTGKTTIDVAFSNTVASGAKAWLTAFWFNPRMESGPACTPVPVTVQGGSVSSMAA